MSEIIVPGLSLANKQNLGPFARAVDAYMRAGWVAIPVDVTVPGNVVAGMTGRRNTTKFPPKPELINELKKSHAAKNIGLWVPHGVIGVDVDAYEGKTGAETITWLAENIAHEPLPPTWTSTCRGPDQPSRIHFYRVPTDRAWTSVINIKDDGGKVVLSGVEIIQHVHRFARVWPSVKNDRTDDVRGRVYRWYAPDGSQAPDGVVPRIIELPMLSPAWQHIFRRRVNEYTGGGSLLDMNDTEVRDWVDNLPSSEDGEPCAVVKQVLDHWVQRFSTSGRHDNMKDGAWALIREGIKGHRGVPDALAIFYDEFMSVTSGDHGRSGGKDDAEWWRAINDGVRKNAGKISGKTVVMCRCAANARLARRMSGENNG